MNSTLKLSVLICFILFLVPKINSQNPFFLIYGDLSLEEIPSNVIEIDNKNYLAVVNTSFYKNSEYFLTAKFICIDNNGIINVLNEFENRWVERIFKIGDKIICIGNFRENNILKSFSIVLDNEYNIIAENIFSIPEYEENDDVFDKNGFVYNNQIYFIYNIAKYNPYENKTTCFIFSQNGDSLKTIHINGIVYDFCRKPDNNEFLLTGHFADFPCSMGAVIQLGYADSLLNIYKADSIYVKSIEGTYHNSIFPESCNIKMIKDKILLGGRVMSYYDGDLIGVGIFDSTTTAIHYNTFGDFEERHLSSRINGIYIDDDTSIFVAGTCGYNGFPYQTFDNYIVVSETDTLLNKKWEHFIGGDAYYELYEIISCSDGGILLSSIRYDENINDNDYDVCFFKLDANGNLTNIENKDLKVSELILYPNPATDQINIRLGAHLHDVILEIYDISGKKLFTQKLENTETQINISVLQTGTYIYKCYNSYREIETGKFVKE